MHLVMFSANGRTWTNRQSSNHVEAPIKVTPIVGELTARYNTPLILSPSLELRVRACVSPKSPTCIPAA